MELRIERGEVLAWQHTYYRHVSVPKTLRQFFDKTRVWRETPAAADAFDVS